ncbi:MAG: hypothetical protein ACRDTG_11500 [Pseudonocardiaceae bacterium]
MEVLGVEFVRVVAEQEHKQGAKILGGIVAGFFTLVAVYFAVLYWPVTLVVVGILLVIAVITAITSS